MLNAAVFRLFFNLFRNIIKNSVQIITTATIATATIINIVSDELDEWFNVGDAEGVGELDDVGRAP